MLPASTPQQNRSMKACRDQVGPAGSALGGQIDIPCFHSASTETLNYSDLYRQQLATAISESEQLGFTRPPLISPDLKISEDLIDEVLQIVNQVSGHFNHILPGYWGNSCQTLSSYIFAHLNVLGIPANIVLGNVLVNGTDEFEATLEELQSEVRATEPPKGAQNVHAWVSLGDDTIIDAALPPRLVRYYKAPPQFDDMIFIGRVENMALQYKCQYVPLLVGTEFFAKTNPPDPMALLAALQGQFAGMSRR